MNETENLTYYPEEEDLAIMPVGYADGDDFFNPNSWTGSAEEDSTSASEADTHELGTPDVQESNEAPAIEQTEDNVVGEESRNAEEAPAIEQTEVVEAKPSNKRRVKYQYNHEDVETEVDIDTDLPELLQKARSTDRYKERIGQMQKRLDRIEATAKALGHDSGDNFLDAILSTARQTERDELIAKGTAEIIADDYVARKYAVPDAPAEESDSSPEQTAQSAPAPETVPAQRDYHAEALELLRAYPDMAGKQLPQEVVADAVANNRPMVEAYRIYREKLNADEMERLRKENSIRKQNEAAAAKAPVSGVTKGGSTEQKATDPFLKGFWED